MTPKVRFDALRGDRVALNLYIQFAVIRVVLVGAFVYFYFLPRPLLVLIVPTTILGLLLHRSAQLAIRLERAGGLVAIAILALGAVLSDSTRATVDAWIFLIAAAALWVGLAAWELRLYGRILSALSKRLA